jgi:ketosteroid isomerase-like protein
MRGWLALVAALVILLSTALTGPARADDAADIRAVIDGQITAFRADDGDAAYGYAAPSIREIFVDPETFMAMVRNGYQPVYRPRSVTFGRLTEENGTTLQEVYVVGPDGESYKALYSLQKQPDGSWKINGCRIVKAAGESA